jgi:hypothetical protein
MKYVINIYVFLEGFWFFFLNVMLFIFKIVYSVIIQHMYAILLLIFISTICVLEFYYDRFIILAEKLN